MPAYCATSKSVSPDRIVQDLLKDLEGVDPAGGLCLLASLADLKHPALLAALAAALPCPVFGGTTISSPLDPTCEEITASLILIKKPGLRFASVLSPPADVQRGGEQMRDLVKDAREKLGERASMFLVIAPFFPNWTEDKFFLPLYAAAGDTPVFGGMASDHVHEGKARTFFETGSYPDRTVLVAIGGDVTPVFAVSCEVKIFTTYNPVVTAANGSILYRVDDLTLMEYLRRQGLKPDAEDFLSGLPLVVKVEIKTPGRPPYAEINHLVSVDRQSGSGRLARDIGEGSAISLGGIDSSCLLASTAGALSALTEQIRGWESRGRTFDAMLAVSCLSRYFYTRDGNNIEGEHLLRHRPNRIPLHGFYGYNEICPARDAEGGWHNRTNGLSIALCAL